MFPNGTDVGACGLPEPEIALVDEFETGYGAEPDGTDGLGLDVWEVERALRDMPVPASLADDAGSEVRFVIG